MNNQLVSFDIASPSIGDVITAESLQKLLSDMTEEEKQEMKQHLPDG